MLFFRAAVVILVAITALPAADTKLVRDTEALTPAEEQTRLHVPEGFEIQLFASEPMINKPINMALDARGRLWVSSTVEYPHAAKRERWADDQGTRVKDSRDAIKILEDTDGDGRADKVTDFADGLNIPTGVLPWHMPEHKAGCIAWSIPNIWYFADTDGDDKADVREVIFGPLGYEKDTHGMCSSFRLGLDGWVYATHGFNNTSHFKAKDGSTLELHSGNVFRFKPDGSRVERWTHGQVNPFGLCWDRYGNLYSADCHSSPLYQLIRGAHYPSFGRPHDGLGFAPVMCGHSHGSTGISGIVYIDSGVWGPEWDDHTFVGNVVTSTVNHDKITFHGSTPQANEAPDFLTSDDPWFRPVDLQLGPDNALYIADFYNKIIGHYEVPLEHPGRDKERGRIWRVVKKDLKPEARDFTRMTPVQITTEIGSPNSARRRLALEEVRERGEKSWLKHLLPCIDSSGTMQAEGDAVSWWYQDLKLGDEPGDGGKAIAYGTTLQSAHALWACSYLGERFNIYRVIRGLHNGGVWVEDAPRQEDGLPGPQLGLVMAHATQVIGNHEKLHPWEKWSLGTIFDARGSAAGRAATQVLLNRPDFPGDEPAWQEVVVARGLMNLLSNMIAPEKPEKAVPWQDPGDVAYIHSMRILLRDFLSKPHVLKNLAGNERVAHAMTKPWFREVIHAVPTAEASALLMAHLEPGAAVDPSTWNHAARHGDEQTLHTAINKARSQTAGAVQAQVQALGAFSDGLSERGAPAHAQLLAWAQELVWPLLDAAQKQTAPAWAATGPAEISPMWALRPRKCADGTTAQVLQSMAQGGGEEEKRTGVLCSQPFPTPAKLALWINGHRGLPNAPAHDKNLVRVVDAKTGEVFASVFPPRSDVCQRAEMDLSKHVGRQARLEIVDGDDGKAYAWLGITRIEPAAVSIADFESRDDTRTALKSLATMLQHTAPAALREKLAAYLPPRPAPPPLPVSPEQRRQLDAIITARLTAFAATTPDIAAGRAVFKTHCATCHRIGGEGGLIGPQLDGIGARGSARLCEDVLDPNRNVDAHFHLHVLTLKDGTTLSGFLKGEAGQIMILADATGREHRVSRKDVIKTEVTPVSLMPPVFAQLLEENAFLDLLGYLVNEKAKN